MNNNQNHIQHRLSHHNEKIVTTPTLAAKQPSSNNNKSYNSEVVDYDLNQFKSDFSDLVKSNMKLIFEQFDKDNDGKISKQELNFVMCNLFPDEVITEQDINEMLIAADLDKNGFIEFEGKILFNLNFFPYYNI